MAMLLSIHGIRTNGEWQERIDPSFEAIDGFIYRKHKYGWFDFWEVPFKGQRDEEIEKFANFYDEHVKDGDPAPSVIAHSFGTYIIGAALERFAAIYFDRIILCGSILATDFDWPHYFEKKRVRAVLNERAGDDGIVTLFRSALTRAAIAHSGPSGVDGFSRKPPGLVERIHDEFQHSDHFILRAHCNRFWRPFIFNNEEFADLSWRYVEDEAEARAEFENRYLPMVKELVRLLFPQKSDDAVAERAETFLRAIAIDGAKGVHRPRALALAKVGKLWIGNE